ncbi:hypothetical protein RR46_07769 [Papilio xuthus]|uniref:Uncharacterized protein n=1 Tax=Papilio xuthus TaxID=66420 RepID=A0A194QGC7_PAPXU|nr:hypothetical protein RR46_07769 [Papilio xuthus]
MSEDPLVYLPVERYNPIISVPYAATNYRQNSCVVRASSSFNTLCKKFDIDPFATSVSSARSRTRVWCVRAPASTHCARSGISTRLQLVCPQRGVV